MEPELLRLLIVEDDDLDFGLTERMLRDGGIVGTLDRAVDFWGARDRLSGGTYDVILADYTLAGTTAREVLVLAQELCPDVPFIVVSGSVGEDVVAELLTRGAGDYVMKDNLLRLLPAIRREVREARDRLARRALEARERRLAFVDAATGLPNLTGLLAWFDHRKEGTPATERFALAAIEVVGYADLSLTLGSRAADEVMASVASRLATCPGPWFAARVAPNGFAVVLPDVAGLDSVLDTLDHGVDVGGFDYRVRTRAGVVGVERGAADPHVLLRNAQTALAGGEGPAARVRTYRPERDVYSRRRLQLLSDLQRPDLGGELYLVYQPRVRLGDGAVLGFEALARWRHPQLGLVPPMEFVSLAESNGEIGRLTQWIVDEAARTVAAWRAAGRRTSVAVNAPVQLLPGPQLLRWLEAGQRAHGLPTGAIEVEVTESQLMRDVPSTRRAVMALRDAGVSVWVDDFGTGFSSLGYLRELPVSGVKIDKSFVAPGLSDPRAVGLVETIVRLARVLGLQVAAEGVETAGTWRMLTGLGCDQAQGYWIGRPMDAAEVPAWWASWQTSTALASEQVTSAVDH